MTVDTAKVSLGEKDIEDYLYDNPGVVRNRQGIPIKQWIGRQFRVPSGIIDLLGVTKGGILAIVEVKLGAIDAGALTQVSRYASDISMVLVSLDLGHDVFYDVDRICVGNRIDSKTSLEASALNIGVNVFSIEISLHTNLIDHTIETFEPFELLAEHPAFIDFAIAARESSDGWHKFMEQSISQVKER